MNPSAKCWSLRSWSAVGYWASAPRGSCSTPRRHPASISPASRTALMGACSRSNHKCTTPVKIVSAVMSYMLVPCGQRTTRLLLKIVMSRHGWLAPVVSLGDLVMARRQLLNFKRLAERPQ